MILDKFRNTDKSFMIRETDNAKVFIDFVYCGGGIMLVTEIMELKTIYIIKNNSISGIYRGVGAGLRPTTYTRNGLWESVEDGIKTIGKDATIFRHIKLNNEKT